MPIMVVMGPRPVVVPMPVMPNNVPVHRTHDGVRNGLVCHAAGRNCRGGVLVHHNRGDGYGGRRGRRCVRWRGELDARRLVGGQ
ncbi:MAG TPA: hypothetical protein VGH54_23450 [Mycobacterium sp.]|jgi:hypothetical protein|uniref:hypothetical protein n=1 Tax=Mycobacterium sp. TaxID=1785 RepID=UPI002F3E570F